jgi:RND family efflux transporter MFP subunit
MLAGGCVEDGEMVMAKMKLAKMGWPLGSLLVVMSAGAVSTGLVQIRSAESQVVAQGGPPGRPAAQPPAVDVSVAQAGSLAEILDYTGTTQPLQSATLRSRGEGLLLNLTVDIGDPVQEGQVVGQLDDILLQADLSQARAEMAARESDVIGALTRVAQAQSQVEQERVALQQAQTDADRLAGLAEEGALSLQDAEQARTVAQTAEQSLRSADNQVSLEEQAVIAAQERVLIQEAVIRQTEERQSQSVLRAPISGIVLARVFNPGDLVRPGEEILQVGNLSQVKVVLQLSELDLGQVQPGQRVEVRLDAFGDETFVGQVSRISPVADATARLIPVEVLIPNSGGRIRSGLLARVQIQVGEAVTQILVPESALGQNSAGDPVVYVASRQEEGVQITARPVTVGSRSDGQVEILSGLEAGEPFVSRTDGQLEDGQTVRLSILSEWQE